MNTENEKKSEDEIKRCGNARKFKSSWKEEFPWLKFESGKNLMYCTFAKRLVLPLQVKQILLLALFLLKRKHWPFITKALVTGFHGTGCLTSKINRPPMGPSAKHFEKYNIKTRKTRTEKRA